MSDPEGEKQEESTDSQQLEPELAPEAGFEPQDNPEQQIEEPATVGDSDPTEQPQEPHPEESEDKKEEPEEPVEPVDASGNPTGEGGGSESQENVALTEADGSATEVIDNSVETPPVDEKEEQGKAEDATTEDKAEGGEDEEVTIADAPNLEEEEKKEGEASESVVKTAAESEAVEASGETETPADEVKVHEEVEDATGTAGEASAEKPEEEKEEKDGKEVQDDVEAIEKPVIEQPTNAEESQPIASQEISEPVVPSEQPEISSFSKANCSVKLVLVTNETTTTAFAVDKPMGQLKDFLSAAMAIPKEFLELQYSGQILDDELTLAQLGATPAGTIELSLYSTNADFVTKRLQSKSDYVMPDVINVTVKDIEGNVKTINIEIERVGAKKPYLGGFLNKQSNTEFLNASCQTNTKLRPWDGKSRFCRDTQTVEEKQELQQTNYNTSTQMTGIGVYVSNMTDKLMTPGKYETADEFLAKREDATVVIQSYFRRWASKNFVEGLRVDRDTRLEWEREEEIRKQKEKEDRIKKEFDRRMNPKSKEDFDLLFHALEKWRIEETAEINANLSGAQRKAALSMLLEQETQLIAAINRHKNDSDKVNKEKAIKSFLDKASAPKKWRGVDGKMTEMDTPYTLRALQLKDIYSSINMKYLTQDERLDILLTLKHTVKEHDCKLSQEIVELIDREADLLMRGVKEDNLEGLRKRISTLFLQYCKTPAFNPEAARLIKVPQDPTILRKGVYHCPSCGLYLPSTEFPLSSNSASPGKCRNCRKVDNDARTRQDYSHYVYMLRQLRLSEEKVGDGSRIALLLQEQDLQYLVENIWGGQSALSQWDDLYDLVLVRWNKYYEWSPWNCILLTKEEAGAHERVENLDQAYRDVFLNRIRQKHSLARNYFSRLSGMAEKVRPVQPKRGKRVLPEDQAEARKELTELFVAS